MFGHWNVRGGCWSAVTIGNFGTGLHPVEIILSNLWALSQRMQFHTLSCHEFSTYFPLTSVDKAAGFIAPQWPFLTLLGESATVFSYVTKSFLYMAVSCIIQYQVGILVLPAKCWSRDCDAADNPVQRCLWLTWLMMCCLSALISSCSL